MLALAYDPSPAILGPAHAFLALQTTGIGECDAILAPRAFRPSLSEVGSAACFQEFKPCRFFAYIPLPLP